MKFTLKAFLLLSALPIIGCATIEELDGGKNPVHRKIAKSVRHKVESVSSYSPEAELAQVEGVAVVNFIHGDYKIIKSSGVKMLDSQAGVIAEKAVTLMTEQEKSYDINVPIRFKLIDAKDAP